MNGLLLMQSLSTLNYLHVLRVKGSYSRSIQTLPDLLSLLLLIMLDLPFHFESTYCMKSGCNMDYNFGSFQWMSR
jgi:hypothetical protein